MYSSHGCDQLELWPGRWLHLSRLPWGGRSPRCLTRVGLVLSLKRERKKYVSATLDLVEVNQLEFWKKKGPAGQDPLALLPAVVEPRRGFTFSLDEEGRCLGEAVIRRR